jgi:hypothetical protein
MSAARGPTPIGAGSTNTSGTLTILNVPGPTAFVTVAHPQNTFHKATAEVTIVEGQPVPVALDLSPLATVAGEFKTRDGRAVTGFNASVLSPDGVNIYRSATVSGSTFTAANVPAGPALLRGRASGSLVSVGEVAVDVPENGTLLTADVPVPLGRVTTSGGRDFWETDPASSLWRERTFYRDVWKPTQEASGQTFARTSAATVT